jgi:hypothetical protein
LGCDSLITLGMEKKVVPLDSPGSKGITFSDAVLVVRNEGALRVEGVGLRLRALQGEQQLFEAAVGLDELGMTDCLEPGQVSEVGVFGLLRRYAKGVGSKVNFFGHKVVLNWDYRVSAEVFQAGSLDETTQAHSWQVRWSAPEADGSVVGVEIT